MVAIAWSMVRLRLTLVEECLFFIVVHDLQALDSYAAWWNDIAFKECEVGIKDLLNV